MSGKLDAINKLEEELEIFANARFHSGRIKREQMLPKLFGMINQDTVNPETLGNVAQETAREWLEDGIQTVVKTPFENGLTGELYNPWTGGYTIVGLTDFLEDDGPVIRAASHNPLGSVYKRYGNNLFPYAMKKAILRMHLDFLRQDSEQSPEDKDVSDIDEYGLDSTRNLKYLSKILPGETLYLGDAVTTNPGMTPMFFGASGCELDAKYVATLLPKDVKAEGTDFAAGYADKTFASLVANELSREFYQEQPKTIEEPEFFARLRRSH